MVGSGILKGLAETARNFVGSFASEERLTTVEYPEQQLPRIEASRNFPFLVYDGDDWHAGMRCVSCHICEKECPPKCIYIEKSTDKKPDAAGKMQAYPARFDIDISVCMSCQICTEVCPFDAIKMDNAFDYYATDRFGELVLDKQKLARSNEYYHQIHPTEASRVDEELAAARAKAAPKPPAAPAAAAASASAVTPATAPKPPASDAGKETNG